MTKQSWLYSEPWSCICAKRAAGMISVFPKQQGSQRAVREGEQSQTADCRQSQVGEVRPCVRSLHLTLCVVGSRCVPHGEQSGLTVLKANSGGCMDWRLKEQEKD